MGTGGGAFENGRQRGEPCGGCRLGVLCRAGPRTTRCCSLSALAPMASARRCGAAPTPRYRLGAVTSRGVCAGKRVSGGWEGGASPAPAQRSRPPLNELAAPRTHPAFETSRGGMTQLSGAFLHLLWLGTDDALHWGERAHVCASICVCTHTTPCLALARTE